MCDMCGFIKNDINRDIFHNIENIDRIEFSAADGIDKFLELKNAIRLYKKTYTEKKEDYLAGSYLCSDVDTTRLSVLNAFHEFHRSVVSINQEEIKEGDVSLCGILIILTIIACIFAWFYL